MQQRKRIHVVTDSSGTVGFNFDLIATIDETQMVNVHGLIANFIVEPINADANSTGTWAITCLPRVSTAIPGNSVTALELEADNPVIWACGLWAASNQTPFCKEIKLGTSRNCQRDTRLVLRVTSTGISAGDLRVTEMMCYFTGM